MRDVVLIVNPFATRVNGETARAVERALARDHHVMTVVTERRGHAAEIAKDAGRSADAVVVFSGDGGFNEVVNGSDGSVPLGFVPGGGTSVLPRALGLPRDPVKAAGRIADALASGRSRRISVGRVNGRRFTFSAGLGIDAEAVRRIDARGRTSDGRRPGDLSFALEISRIVAERRGRFEPRLEIEGLGRAAFALVANTHTYTFAGRLPLRVAPAARFECGLDVLAPRYVRPRSIPRLLASITIGRGHTSAADIAYAHDLDRVVVRCDEPMPLQVDGEDLGDVLEAVFEAERGAVRVLA
ncbi:MAG: hypothetical protein M3M94_01040 [Actinomycetota bacterium]|nr:hypothetical protein [Actinomycetota bacterium]